MAKTYSKVVYGGNTLIDLTGDTVTADKILAGYKAHDKSGLPITGTSTFDSDTSDATAGAAEILTDKTAYVAGTRVIGTMPNRGAVNGTISSKTEQFTIPQGYHDGSGKVSIASSEQAKIVPNNIRQGVVILGVEGTMSGSEDVHAQAVSVTPSAVQQIITPDTASGYDYISQVTVAAIPYTETLNSSGGYTATIG